MGVEQDEGNLEEVLAQTEQEISDSFLHEMPSDWFSSWSKARSIIQDFKPVPWFIWRLGQFVLGHSGRNNEVSEGALFGLKRIVIAAAQDPVMGSGGAVSTVRAALQTLSSDVLASAVIIYSVSRKLKTRPFERIWQPILDDAILRAHLGFYVGQMQAEFGAGRGMLSGFAGRVGVCILIATGEEGQAEKALELLASGRQLREVGLSVYGCDPTHISAFLFSAVGVGKDAAFGTAAFSLQQKFGALENRHQGLWLSSLIVTDLARTKQIDQVPSEAWKELGFTTDAEKAELMDLVTQTIRNGHGWDWLT